MNSAPAPVVVYSHGRGLNVNSEGPSHRADYVSAGDRENVQQRNVLRTEGIGHIDSQVNQANQAQDLADVPDDRQSCCTQRRHHPDGQWHTDPAGRNGPVALRRVAAVGFAVHQVVEDVHPAGHAAEAKKHQQQAQ